MKTVYRVAAALLFLIVGLISSAAAASGNLAFWRDDYHELLLGPETEQGPNPVTSMLATYEWALALIFALFFLGLAAWGFRKGFDLLHTPENRMTKPWDYQ